MKKHETVVIAGSHPNRVHFDFNRQDCDIWVFNEAVQNFKDPHVDLVFQMHRPEIWRNPLNRNSPEHIGWLMSNTATPVVMQEQYSDVPASFAYPLGEIESAFGKTYFTSSIAYAIALGILWQYKRIEIYGCELETGTEYAYQRDGYTYWVGIARGRGIDVFEDNKILDAPLYGYEGEAALKLDFFTTRLAGLEPIRVKLETEYNQSRENANRALTNLANNTQDPKAVAEILRSQLNAAAAYGTIDGSIQEIQRYIKKANVMTDTAGAFLFSRQEFETSLQVLRTQHAHAQTAQAAQAGATGTEFERTAKFNNRKRRRMEVEKLCRERIGELVKVTIQTGQYAGAAQENTRALMHLDTLIKAAGGAKSEAVLLAAAGG